MLNGWALDRAPAKGETVVAAFLAIGAIGVVLLLIALLVGDFFDGLLDLGGDLFSGAAFAAFLGALGFVGAMTYAATDSTATGVGVGAVAGVGLGALVGLAMSRLKRGGDDATVRSGDLVWKEGTVVSPIPAEGYGEVSLVIAGHLTKLNARAPEALPAGTAVVVTAVLSPTSVSVESR